MYDYASLTLTFPDNDPGAEQRLVHSVAFAGVDGELDQRGRLRSLYKGMRLDYIPEAKVLRWRGSLHTYAQGNNLGTFSPAEIATTCAAIAEAVDMPADLFEVTRLEVGLNLPVATNPRHFLEDMLVSHGTSRFVATAPRPGTSHPLEYNAHHTDYRVKFYDKGTYARQQGRTPPANAPPHLLRYEIAFERARAARKVSGLPLLTLADLPRPPVMNAFASHLTTHWNQTNRRQPVNYDSLTLAECALLHTANDHDFWRNMRKSQPRSTCARNQAKARAMVRERSEPHPYDEAFTREVERLNAAIAAAA